MKPEFAQAASRPLPAMVPLVDAAQQLNLDWAQTWRLVLKGQLIGRRLSNGRWAATQDSLAALVAARDA